jgi:hypothetical protein
MDRRHPDIGIGVRPRGPLVFRVAEQLSLISDALYLESLLAQRTAAIDGPEPAADTTAADQALMVARWIRAGRPEVADAFPGRRWLSQPQGCSDRDWVLEIARQYRTLGTRGTSRPVPAGG